MISEKESRTIDAVNFCRGEEFASGCFITVIRCCSGLIYFPTENRCPNTVCTAEHYNQLIEDMASAKWMSDCVGYDYSNHVFACKMLHNIDTSNKELLKRHCDYSFYDKPLVYTQGELVELYVEEHDTWYKGEFITEFKGNLIAKVSDHDKYGDGYVDEYDSIHIRPIKTPEQIKQDKLKEQVIDLVETFQEEYQDGNGLADLIELMQSNGYIVQPK